MRDVKVYISIYKQNYLGSLERVVVLDRIAFSEVANYLNKYCRGRSFEYTSNSQGTLCMTESKTLVDSNDFRIVVYFDYM